MQVLYSLGLSYGGVYFDAGVKKDPIVTNIMSAYCTGSAKTQGLSFLKVLSAVMLTKVLYKQLDGHQ